MAFDAAYLEDLVDAAAEHGPDENEATAGGGSNYEPPAEGYVRLRLVSYIELGVHEDTVKGQTKKKDLVILEFECSGPKHPVREDGKPHIIQVRLPKSTNEKANYYKLFKRLNHDGKAKRFAQLLGKAFLGTVVHNVTGEGDNKRVYANLRGTDGYTIRPAFKVDDETGESLPVAVDKPLSALRVFIWDAEKGLKDMWDSIFIDGTYEVKAAKEGGEPEQRSKNYFQNLIRKAINFPGSPIAVLLGAGGEEPDIDGAEKPARDEVNVERSKDAAAGASDDPLAGM